jgi:hypothetical protein|tara:strand:- start:277 stop:651 length:375 start_codon:yes stop_codon:yes gene_type:complete
MGLMSAVTGNASEVQPEDVMDTIGPLLAEGEQVTKAYKMIRDFFVFTSSRVILVDVKGATGKKRNFRSIPYRNIISWTIESAGFGFDDSELELNIVGNEVIKKEFKKSINIADVQSALAQGILK